MKLVFVLSGLMAVMAFHARAEVIYVTPAGTAGYTADGTRIASTRRFETSSFRNLQPGDVVQLLAEAPEVDHVTLYKRARIEIFKVPAAVNPVVVRGLGARTRIQGRPLSDFRCTMPADPDAGGCGDRHVASLKERALRSLVSFERSRAQGPLGDFLAAAPSVLNLGPDALMAEGGDPHFVALSASGHRYAGASCFELVGVEGIVFEHIHFEDCWLSAIRATQSRSVTLRDSLIVGGTWGLTVLGSRESTWDVIQPSNITVERVTWIQDPTGYADPFRGICMAGSAWRDGCPGIMWRNLPWGVTHHGAYAHFNGALLAGKYVVGDVVFRGNNVLNAYNGIRLTARRCAEPTRTPRIECPFNARIWVYGNLFSYVRDNPVEFEHWASDAFVFHNRFHNSHAWLSFDGTGGGPVYAYGNVGWFDDRPANWGTVQGCKRNATVDRGAHGRFDPSLDRVFDPEAGWLPVGEVELRDNRGVMGWEREMRCEQSVIGRTLKFSLPEVDDQGNPPELGEYNLPRRGPIYVFNNSWLLRAPVTGQGAPANVRHWNNAIQFCEPAVAGYGVELCRPENAPTKQDCGTYVRVDHGLERYVAGGATPFFDCFRWQPFDEAGKDVTDISNEFDWDVSSNGFPPGLPTGFEQNGRSVAPGFAAGDRGDFRLSADAPAAVSGCRVHDPGDGRLSCDPVVPRDSFAGALDRDGRLYGGPGTDRFRPPL